MKKVLLLSVLAITFVLALGVVALAADQAKPAEIPGINAPDPKPDGCISCHNKRSETQDYSLPTALAKLNKEAKHPAVKLASIPQDCQTCHQDTFKNLMHSIHLAKEGTHFIAAYQGQCMYCHALNKDTGAMTVKSGQVK